MIRIVPYLAEAAIEKDAESLLLEFSDARDVVIEAPIPIEEVTEKHLKIGIEFDDLDPRFGVEKFFDTGDPDILGAMYFDKKRIAVSEQLDPENSPNMAQAFSCCVTEWMNRSPEISSSDQCAACGGGDSANEPLLPFGGEPDGHAWLHSRCWQGWYDGRKDDAATALAKMGIEERGAHP